MKYLLIILFVFTGQASAEVYKWTDSAGHVHFGDKLHKTDKAEKISLKVNNRQSTPNNKNSTAPIPELKKTVMYGTTWCGYCKMAREYFRKENIPYTEYDIEKDEQAKSIYDSFEGKGVPVIFVGQERMNGFSIAEFNQLYK
jgi:glutaredoxin